MRHTDTFTAVRYQKLRRAALATSEPRHGTSVSNVFGNTGHGVERKINLNVKNLSKLSQFFIL